MILGVSKWLGEKLGWNVTFIRLAFVVAAVFYGAGVGLYLILWIVKLLSN